MNTKRQNPETIAIHGGDYRSDPTTRAVAVPIYRTTSYQFDSTKHAANLLIWPHQKMFFFFYLENVVEIWGVSLVPGTFLSSATVAWLLLQFSNPLT